MVWMYGYHRGLKPQLTIMFRAWTSKYYVCISCVLLLQAEDGVTVLCILNTNLSLVFNRKIP